MNMINLKQGDCLELMKEIPDKSVDMILCDLPYFNISKSNWDKKWENKNDYLIWVNNVVLEYKRLLKDNGNILLFTSRQLNRFICNILDKYFIEQRIIIWKRKRNFNTTRGKTLSSGYEPICWYSNSNTFTFNNIKVKVKSGRKEYTEGTLKDGITMSDVIDTPALPHNSKEKVAHTAQKPIALIEPLIEQFSNENDIILDNCMGSGTTGVVCKKLKRNFIGIELDENYFNIAKERIESANVKRD